MLNVIPKILCRQAARSLAARQLGRPVGAGPHTLLLLRTVSTTNKPQIAVTKNKKDLHDTTSVIGDMGDIVLRPGLEPRPPGPKTPEEFMDVYGQRNWVSWGYDYGDFWEDRIGIHMIAFMLFTIMFGTSFLAYTYVPEFW